MHIFQASKICAVCLVISAPSRKVFWVGTGWKAIFLWKSSELQRLVQAYHLLPAAWGAWLPGPGHALSCGAVTHWDRSVILTALVRVLPCLVMDSVPAYTSWRSSLTVTQHPHLCSPRNNLYWLLGQEEQGMYLSVRFGFSLLPLFTWARRSHGWHQGCLPYVANVLLASWGWFVQEHSHSTTRSWLVSSCLRLRVSGSTRLLWGARGFLCSQSCLLRDSLFVLQGRDKRWERSLGFVLATRGLLPSEVDRGSSSKPACPLWAHQAWV